MNLTKTLTIIFSVLTLCSLGYLFMTGFLRSQKQESVEFFDPEGTHYVNYYLRRSEFRLKLTLDNLVLEKGGVGKAEFKRNSNVDAFIADWSVFNELLYPNTQCEYIRVSIPAESNNLASSDIQFACVDSYINDYLNLENVQ